MLRLFIPHAIAARHIEKLMTDLRADGLRMRDFLAKESVPPAVWLTHTIRSAFPHFPGAFRQPRCGGITFSPVS